MGILYQIKWYCADALLKSIQCLQSVPIVGFFVLVSVTACQPLSDDEEHFKVGFSQCISTDSWRQAMLLEIQQEAFFQKGLHIEIKDAQGNSERQAAQIDSFVRSQVDALIVSPHESSKILEAAAEQARNAGIPLILLDRKVNTPDYTAFVGADNYEIGKAAGALAKETLGAKGSIVEIWGVHGASPSIERHRGFQDELRSTLIDVYEVNGWADTNQVAQGLAQIKEQLAEVDLVFGHTDVLAVSAYEAFKEWELEEGVVFIGIDGLLEEGMTWVEQQKMNATFLYPTGGTEAIQLVSDILYKRPFEKDLILPTTLITKENLSVMKAQAFRIQHQQRNISLQQENFRIKELANLRQQTLLWSLGIGSLIILGLSIFLWSANKEKQHINNELKQKNQEITEQKNRVEEISKEKEEVSEAKVRFFSHISHEIRTPLTLIFSPLQEAMKAPQLSDQNRKDLTLAQTNVSRLLRLMNELLDFRKLEKKQLDINVCEVDLGDFIVELLEPFHSLAKTRSILLENILTIENQKAWIDPALFDKVITNLISNAFKNTFEHGKVWCELKDNESENTIVIEIGDTGIGMTPKELPHIFNPFFQGEQRQGTGVGLGLSLTKELVDLHQAKISVESEYGKGTLFRIVLKKGNTHFQNSQISLHNKDYVSNRAFIDPGPVDLTWNKESNNDDKPLLLLIEDHLDLANYLYEHLEDSYEILVENDGVAGLETAIETIPDIVLCDVAMPLMNGLKLTQILKEDSKTSHIPIIILTARTDFEDRIAGLKVQADSYLTKPFHLGVLRATLETQLQNRALLRQYHRRLYPFTASAQPESLDASFVRHFHKTIEENINNQDLNVEFVQRALNMSRVQLFRKVKAVLGTSVNQSIMEIRLQQARELLINSDIPIAEVAYAKGFSSPSYFSTTFKTKFGSTPAALRKKYRKNKA